MREKYRLCLLVVSFFSLLCWAYSVGIQFFLDGNAVYWELAWWLPWLRIDYFGEAGFVVSFLCAVAWALTSESKSHL